MEKHTVLVILLSLILLFVILNFAMLVYMRNTYSNDKKSFEENIDHLERLSKMVLAGEVLENRDGETMEGETSSKRKPLKLAALSKRCK